jgi:hypothetical protein
LSRTFPQDDFARERLRWIKTGGLFGV